MNVARRLLLALLVPALVLTIFAVNIVAAGGSNDKTTLCHLTGNGSYHQITISDNAVSAHLAHGDVQLDQYGNCP